jgi:signal transduction histidine kinase
VPKTRDVLAALAGTLNSLLERLHGSLDEQRHFVAAASHELRTPLAALQAELDLDTRPGRSQEEMRVALAALARRVDQLVRLSSRLLVLAQGDAGALGINKALP